MCFQLPVCSCEPNYHSSQKIAALWKKKREGVLFSFLRQQSFAIWFQFQYEKFSVYLLVLFGSLFFDDLVCHILVSLSCNILIVYVMGTDIEVPLLRYGHFWDVYFYTYLYVIDLFSGETRFQTFYTDFICHYHISFIICHYIMAIFGSICSFISNVTVIHNRCWSLAIASHVRLYHVTGI